MMSMSRIIPLFSIWLILSRFGGSTSTHVDFTTLAVKTVICKPDTTTTTSYTACAYSCYHTPCCIAFSYNENEKRDNCWTTSEQPEIHSRINQDLTKVHLIAGLEFRRQTDAALERINHEAESDCWRSCELLCSSNMSCRAYAYEKESNLCKMSNVTSLLHTDANQVKSTVYWKSHSTDEAELFKNEVIGPSGGHYKLYTHASLQHIDLSMNYEYWWCCRAACNRNESCNGFSHQRKVCSMSSTPGVLQLTSLTSAEKVLVRMSYADDTVVYNISSQAVTDTVSCRKLYQSNNVSAQEPKNPPNLNLSSSAELYIHADEITNVSITQESAVESQQFCVWQNQRDSSLSTATHQTSSEFDCLIICMTHSGCEAINYSKSSSLCELGRTEENMYAGMERSSDTVHYSTKHVFPLSKVFEKTKLGVE